MVHRRLLHDDGRGVGEPLNEPGTDGEGLTITGTHYVVLSPPAQLAAMARISAAKVFAPLQPMLAPLNGSVADYVQSHLTNSTVLRSPLPPSVEVMTLQTHDSDNGIILLRLAHQLGLGEDAELSAPVTLDLSQLFVPSFSSVTELSLTANQARDAFKPYEWSTQSAQAHSTSGGRRSFVPIDPSAPFNVTIGPAEIRSHILLTAAHRLHPLAAVAERCFSPPPLSRRLWLVPVLLCASACPGGRTFNLTLAQVNGARSTWLRL